MTRALPHLIGFLLPPVIILGATLGGGWTFLPVFVLYAGLPIADTLAGRTAHHPDADAVRALEDEPAFRLVTWAWVPVQVALLVWTLDWVTDPARTGLERAGIVFSMGSVAGAVGITFAHELLHRPGRFERALGDVLLAAVSYPHFAIEHVHGHHRHVGTPDDPATARLGEGYWSFLLRTLTGGLRHAWRVETSRLRRSGRTAWAPANTMLRYAVTMAVVCAIAWTAWGLTGVAVFFAQGLVAVMLLEGINYVEHYGLVRHVADGRYERVSAFHSWDSRHRASNWLLINLARHADHHCVASRRYPALATLDPAPQLPAGYGSMLLLALVPPLWRRVMDPRVAAARAARTGGI
ncbi:MAG TPA: alkane 1-monooxygenase [Vicinamibacterales bacterium]|nr:alkane 1-monooxygenase [Vicinamibacterales bacterium]